MGFNLLPPPFDIVEPGPLPPEVKGTVPWIRVEVVYPGQIYTLTNKYLGSYTHRPESFAGYLYACLLEGSNVDCLFSVNAPDPTVPEPTWTIEFARLSTGEMRIYFGARLLVTFPAYSHAPGVPKPGYYVFSFTKQP